MAAPIAQRQPPSPSAAELRRPFDESAHGTVGLEEELMLLDPETLNLCNGGALAMEAVNYDDRFRRELPASQLEIVTSPGAAVADPIAELAAARTDLAQATAGSLRLATAGTHPFALPMGVVSEGERYQRILEEYGWIAMRELVFGMHVHVAVRGSTKALAVYNALRCYLPEIAVLAGNSPFFDSVDTGLASVRPKIAEALPRQGIPPRFDSWQAFADLLAWGRTSGSFPDAKHLWWELRLHASHGTLEIRVADAQSTVEDAAAVAAFIQALVISLAARFEAGEPLLSAPGLRIAENRWRALRHGTEGSLIDLATGIPVPTRERLEGLIAELMPTARQLGAGAELAHARDMLGCSGAARQRGLAESVGLRGLVERLSDMYVPVR